MKRVFSKITVLLCLFSLIFSGCSRGIGKSENVAKINNREISKSEFMLYLFEATQDFKSIGGNDIWDTDFDGQSAEELVKERAFSALQNVILTGQKAEFYGVKLTAEDKVLAKEEAEEELKSMTEDQKKAVGVSAEQMQKIMEDTFLYRKVYAEVIKGYQPSDMDFQAYYEQNKARYADTYTEYTLKSILVKDEATAAEIVKKAKAGEDFQKLFEQYELDKKEKETGGIIETYKGHLESVFGMEFNLGPGEISEPLKTNEGYFVLRVENKRLLEKEELSEMVKKEYTETMKRQLFTNEFTRWTEEAKIEKNEEVWASIEMVK